MKEPDNNINLINNKINNDNINNDINNNEYQKDNESNDDSLEGEKYAKAIEDIANKIYNQNLIPDIKITQKNQNQKIILVNQINQRKIQIQKKKKNQNQ